MKPKVIVLTGYGINCEEETAYCFEKTGAEAEIVHINDLIENSKKLKNYQIMAIPGGFAYGDDTGAGIAYANRIKNNLPEELLAFAKQDKLIIGICNGCQILANTGLAPAVDNKYGERQVAFMHNITARYECRWIYIKTTSSKCIWTKNIDILHIPVSHGEGNFYTEKNILKKLKANDQIVSKYVYEDGSPAHQKFPINPNGAMEDIAAVCDPSGRILAIMPHPERFHCFTNEDNWELKKEKLIRESKPLPSEGAGLKIFKNAVKYFTCK